MERADDAGELSEPLEAFLDSASGERSGWIAAREQRACSPPPLIEPGSECERRVLVEVDVSVPALPNDGDKEPSPSSWSACSLARRSSSTVAPVSVSTYPPINVAMAAGAMEYSIRIAVPVMNPPHGPMARRANP